MNYIYCASIKGLEWSHLQSQKKILNSSTQKDLEQFRFNEDKCRSLVGKMLLLYILKKHENFQKNTLPDISYNHYQKPIIDSMQGGFNISHSNSWVVCAYNDQGAIGVDIEKKVPINIHEYKEALTNSEYYSFINNKKLDFFQLWTLKEAIMKAEGSGFFLSPSSFEIPFPFINHSQINIKENNWYLYSQNFQDQYMLSIASAHNTEHETVVIVLQDNILLT
ncbi:4'-phosphopantetheinyl transferase family protein [Entomomonas asaccharolytica]|uniref:4'-phosphopantetheinyl transferase superfamily protein n=1 Tax=Entomomonas asaccharolytica TaxID=2785331 RepID=A0A974NHN9_9GAMM|nr:4'-phosphopantetheinyl transferase superfamily protein [Entomomonas asaccharolytica]QQP86789.1 4'-phosphopantetheinyl transferase superfamily protein [Entomomonas asaccharolytica]